MEPEITIYMNLQWFNKSMFWLYLDNLLLHHDINMLIVGGIQLENNSGSFYILFNR